MSYCRFSSDNWKSDVYVYDAGYAKVIHVAGRKRLIAPIPELPASFGIKLVRWSGAKWNDKTRKLEFDSRTKAVVNQIGFWLIGKINWFNHFTLSLIPLVSLKLPHAGETFETITAWECIEKLEYLRELGYNVPQYALDDLLREYIDSCLQG